MPSAEAPPRRPLVVISLDGFARASLGCYGSSWNHTPAIDAVAAGGCVWDRMIATSDQPAAVLRRWFDPSNPWAVEWSKHGAIELVTDASSIEIPKSTCFDRVTKLSSPTDPAIAGPADQVVNTQLGRLIEAAVERDQQDDSWSVLWLHSDYLIRNWDAPANLFPVDELDQISMEPIDDSESIDAAGSASGDVENPTSATNSPAGSPIPPLFDTVTPPRIQLDGSTHPDLVTSWMRTYGCQIRLLDLLIEVLLGSLNVEDPWFVLVGTSGFSFGQNGWIGQGCGPLRTAEIQVPLVVSDCGPLRVWQVVQSDQFLVTLHRLAGNDAVVSPEDWNRRQEMDATIRTVSTRARKVISTAQWFYVQDADQSEHLYWKPDDIEDFNDVARVRDDIVGQMRDAATG